MEIVPIRDFYYLLSFKLTGYCALTSYRVAREESESGLCIQTGKISAGAALLQGVAFHAGG